MPTRQSVFTAAGDLKPFTRFSKEYTSIHNAPNFRSSHVKLHISIETTTKKQTNPLALTARSELPEASTCEEVFVYLSYENESNNWVYFDDMEVTHTKTNVIQYNEYYAFGLQTNASWARVDEQPNQYLYNSGTELNATTGWYETMFRDYDPAIGRFMQVDAVAGAYAQWSPYAYAMNNPVLMNDPTGLYPAWYPEGYGEGGDLEHRLFRDYSEGWSRRGENGSRYGGGSWGGGGGGGGRYSPSARQIGNFIGQLVTSAHGGTWSEPWGLHVFGSEQEAAAWAARTINSADGWIFGSTEPDAYAKLQSIANGDAMWQHFKYDLRWTTKSGSNVKFRYLGLAKGAAQQDPRFGPGERADASMFTRRENDVGIATLVFEFFSGLGPEYSLFGPGHPLVEGLRRSYVVDLARAKFKLEGSKGFDHWNVPFGIIGAAATGGNVPGQFAGGVRITIIPTSEGNVFIVNNTTGRHSFYAHSEPNIPRNSSGLGPAEGNIYQRFYWLEPR